MTRVVLGVMTAALVPATALAQAPAPPPPPGAAPAPVPPAPPPAAAPEAPPAAVAPPPEAAPPPPAPLPEPAPPAPPPPAEEVVPQAPPLPPAAEEEKAEDTFKITTGVGFRGAVRFQSTDDPEAFDDVWFDELNVETRFSGKVTDVVGWTANLTVDGRTNTSAADGPGPIKFQAQALDLIGQLDFADEFHVWMGRMLTPTDRSNFSGAWFMSPWNYSGVYADAYIGPRGTEEVGREVGAVVWGNDKSGKFKYYAGVMDLDNPELTPLYVGRLNFAAIGEEPGFYGSSTYYGTKDILAIGAAVQYQNQSTAIDNPDTDADERDEELFGFNADVLAEFVIPNAGTITGEVGYYHLDGPVFAAEDAYYALASYLTPEPIGIGKVQVLGRLQQTMEPDRTAIEGVLSYVIKDYFAKLALSFTHFTNADESKANWLQLGFQIQQ